MNDSVNDPFNLKPPSFEFSPQNFKRLFDPRSANMGGGDWGNAGRFSMEGAGGFQQPGADMSSFLGDYGGFGGEAFGGNTPATSGFNLGQSLWGTGPGAKGSGLFGGDAGIMNSFSQQTNADGSTYGNWGGMGLGLAQAGYGIYSGMQNNKRADKMMDWSQDRHNMALDSYEKEKSSYYADQSTRQRTRNIDNPNSVQHDQYMNGLGDPAYSDKAYS